MNEITVFIKSGKIVIDFERGLLHIDALNLVSRIKRLADVNGAVISRSRITVSLSSARNVASVQREISTLANSYTVEAPEAAQNAQLSLF